MPKSLKRCVIAAALTASVGLAQTAHANALAVSDALLSSLLFRNALTGQVLDVSNFTTLAFTNSATVTASLGGAAATQSGAGSPLDLYACAPGSVGCPANNTFPFTMPPPTSTFALADQLESGAPISGLGFPTGATVNAGAYASLTMPTSGDSNATNRLAATFTFAFPAATPITIEFNARAYVDAFTAAGEPFPTNAISGINVCFDIVGPVLVHWCPNGVPAPADVTDTGIVTSTEPFSLNVTRAAIAPTNGNNQFGPFGPGFFSATTVPLLSGQLSAVEQATASALEVAQVVPEPATLLLLGVGMLGFGFARRKLSKKH